MASLSQSSWFCSLHTTKKHTLFIPTNPRATPVKTLKISACSLGSSKDESSPPNSSDAKEESLEETKPGRVKLAFERARGYKKSLQLVEVQETIKDPVGESAGIVSGSGGLVFGDDDEGRKENAGEYRQSNGIVGDEENGNLPGDEEGGKKEGPEAFRMAMEKSREYQKSKGTMGNERSSVDSENSPEDEDGGKEVVLEAVRIAMEKAPEYKKKKELVGDNQSNKESEQLPGNVGSEDEVPEDVRIAFGKAMEYSKNKGTLNNSSGRVESLKLTGGSASDVGDESNENNTGKTEDLKISSIDFVGLNFDDKKKSRGLPAGLVPIADPFPEGDLPEVEILLGDASKFGNAASSETKTSSEESSDLYKPKVSTWGVFPRPSNISKTFGGGRNIRPGEAIETPEDRATKEARTRQLLAAYKRKTGMIMDPKLKAECEKALNDGDSLMDVGRLKEALPYYQKVMDKLAFQTELHGLAALQWSICQDSLSRPEKARVMYEKLQTHPNALVSKRAKQFMFSFQAMEIMKVTKSSVSGRNTGYQKYFEAFVEDESNYTSGSSETQVKEDALNQALPYILFLASPILLVLLVAASKGI